MFTCGRPKEYTSRFTELQEAVKIGEKRFGTYLDDVKSTDKALKHKAILEANLLYLLYEYDEKLKLEPENELLKKQRDTLQLILYALNEIRVISQYDYDDCSNLTKLFDQNPSVFRNLMLFKDSCSVGLASIVRSYALSQCYSEADKQFIDFFWSILMGAEKISLFTERLEDRPRIKRFYNHFSIDLFSKDEEVRWSFGTDATMRVSSFDGEFVDNGERGELSAANEQFLCNDDEAKGIEQEEELEQEEVTRPTQEDVDARHKKILPLIVVAYYEHPQKTMVLTAKAGFFSAKENHLSDAKKLGVQLLKQCLRYAMYDVEYIEEITQSYSIDNIREVELKIHFENLLKLIKRTEVTESLAENKELLEKIKGLSKTEPFELIATLEALKSGKLGKIVEWMGGIDNIRANSKLMNKFLLAEKKAREENPPYIVPYGVT